MHELDLTRARWRKSTYSSGSGQCVEVAHVRTRWRKSSRSGASGACVEVADLRETVAVRDSKDPAGPALVFTPADWQAFVSSLKDGHVQP